MEHQRRGLGEEEIQETERQTGIGDEISDDGRAEELEAARESAILRALGPQGFKSFKWLISIRGRRMLRFRYRQT